MDQEARSAFTRAVRDEIFSSLGLAENLLEDLNGFENFVFRADQQIVRITHDSHRSAHQLMGELEFLEYLAANRAPVSAPLRFGDDELVRSFGDFHVCLFRHSAGSSLRGKQPQAAQVLAWGRAIGMFHRLTMDFSPAHRRQDWQSDENHQFHSRIPAQQQLVLDAADRLLNTLSLLPRDDWTYGLVHSDAHPGNFLVQDDQLTFFDFDDCLYSWFGYDIATILFGVALDAWSRDTTEDAEQTVADFFRLFLEGYEREMPRSSLLLDAMPIFLKLREFSLYAVILAHLGDEQLEGMPAVFMRGRQQRLEAGLPFLELSFQQFA